MDNKAVVTAFIDAWNELDWTTIESLLAEDIAYQNMPWEPYHGREAVMESLKSLGVEESDWITHNQIGEGDLVINERTDRVRMNGVWKSVRLMGIFRLRDGLICEWREYFDPGELAHDIPPPEHAR